MIVPVSDKYVIDVLFILNLRIFVLFKEAKVLIEDFFQNLNNPKQQKKSSHYGRRETKVVCQMFPEEISSSRQKNTAFNRGKLLGFLSLEFYYLTSGDKVQSRWRK